MQIDWWAGTAGVVIGALVAFAVPLLWSLWQRCVERSGELTAMLEELREARGMMDALPGTLDRASKELVVIHAPLYRLPLTFFEHALPKLIGEGKLTETETRGLVEFVTKAEELNRGLDGAAAADARGLAGAMDACNEWLRNCSKLQLIVENRPEHLAGLTVFEVAETALRRLLRRGCWLQRVVRRGEA